MPLWRKTFFSEINSDNLLCLYQFSKRKVKKITDLRHISARGMGQQISITETWTQNKFMLKGPNKKDQFSMIDLYV